MFVSRIPASRTAKFPFRNGSKENILFANSWNKIQRFLHRRTDLKRVRADAMSPRNLALHFARLNKTYEEFSIEHEAQVFKLDEAGFSTRNDIQLGYLEGRSKAFMRKEGRINTLERQWSNNAKHFTLMPAVSADGKEGNPISIFPGVKTKWRELQDGVTETPAFFILPNDLFSSRDPTRMDSTIF